MRRLGIPSASSKFHGAALEVLERGLGSDLAPAPPALHRQSRSWEVIGARGRDLPRLVGLELIDAALTGLDAYLEATLSGHDLSAWMIVSKRPSRLSLMASGQQRVRDFRMILSEYPLLTAAWFAAYGGVETPEIIAMRGSIEGLVSRQAGLGGVATVVTGDTMRANGLVVCVDLLQSDMCLVTRPGDLDRIGQFESVLKGPVTAPEWASLQSSDPNASAPAP